MKSVLIKILTLSAILSLSVFHSNAALAESCDAFQKELEDAEFFDVPAEIEPGVYIRNVTHSDCVINLTYWMNLSETLKGQGIPASDDLLKKFIAALQIYTGKEFYKLSLPMSRDTVEQLVGILAGSFDTYTNRINAYTNPNKRAIQINTTVLIDFGKIDGEEIFPIPLYRSAKKHYFNHPDTINEKEVVLIVDTTPSNAEVYVNGNHVGITPFQGEITIDNKNVELSFEKEDHYSFTKNVRYETGSVLHIPDAFKLIAKEIHEEVFISMQPYKSGYQVRVDGKDIYDLPYTQTLTVGDHTLELLKGGEVKSITKKTIKKKYNPNIFLEEFVARPIMSQYPMYPNAARKNKTEGCVTLAYKINSSGRTHDIEVVNSSHDKVFDKEAIRAMKKWKFNTPRDNVNMTHYETMVFTLSNTPREELAKLCESK